MRKNRIAAAALTVATSLGIILGTGTSANAAITEFCSGNLGGPGPAWGCFYSDGDVFKVYDAMTDGRRAELVWTSWDGQRGVCTDANGANSTPGVCNVDLKEGANSGSNAALVTFHVQTRDGATGPVYYVSQPVIAYVSGR
ncbi:MULTISPECIES: hypothetical protein [unclassified Streptomyces]|uniref:hypothetical protein n=1 Tax=unclassified Streptomyces TaxID=2593676 RepID=UPI002DD96752|nr:MULTISPECIES: hypothetical protein [unclassified Streptomyces]WSC39194.1 hypothetical protein OHA08_28870 [Streptomyces sp. NBC_01763]WSC53679.1 hypothetical protein OG808_16230 [Streptomyces sp. NBC_01761]WSF84518.1 hypothetical protein OIE70_16325 [Streptomyces sp. NBC_01744]WSJ51087.1 hypothetical protein OG243_16945 [Streptomyces sp. NBC_01318]